MTMTMKERPIIFSGEMVKAILEGRKTQTRRLVKPQPTTGLLGAGNWYPCAESPRRKYYATHKHFLKGFLQDFCPHKISDHLWVRETWADVNTENGPAILYRANNHYHFCQDDAYPVEYERYPGCQFTMWCGDLLRGEIGHAWRPSIHMPRWASRVTLEITDVRVERIRDSTEKDAQAEGFENNVVIKGNDYQGLYAQERFWSYWEYLYTYVKGSSWSDNPWVWVIEFRRITNE